MKFARVPEEEKYCLLTGAFKWGELGESNFQFGPSLIAFATTMTRKPLETPWSWRMCKDNKAD